jgi:hypothetical protein
MGWDGRYIRYGEKIDMAEEVRQRYTWSGNKAIKVVRGKRRGNETPYYVAVQKDDGQVWAGIVLTQRRGDELMMKPMAEDEGPYCHDAVAGKILPLLSPTENEYALAWREGVAQAVIKEKNQPKVKSGDVLKFDKPMEFNYGGFKQFFIWKEKNIFSDLDGRGRYKIPNWKLREFKVLSTEEIKAEVAEQARIFAEKFGVNA